MDLGIDNIPEPTMDVFWASKLSRNRHYNRDKVKILRDE